VDDLGYRNTFPRACGSLAGKDLGKMTGKFRRSWFARNDGCAGNAVEGGYASG